MKSIDWNLARAFCATADSGSLSKAAAKVGLTQPTLSRQVAALEEALGVTLFDRVGKKLVLTDAALGLLEHARAMAAAADAISLAAAGRIQQLAGRVTISATDVVAAYLLPDAIERIRREAPEITLEIVASNSLSDLRRREADIAIRHVRPTEPELIGRLIGQRSARFYASEAWVSRNGIPQSAEDLRPTELIGFEPIDKFALHMTAAGIPVTADAIRLYSENAVVVWELVRRGLGIGVMLTDVAERTPGMVRVLYGLPDTPVPFWLVSHRELRTSPRVRKVFDCLAEALTCTGTV